MENISWKKGLGLIFAAIITFTTPLRATEHFVTVNNSFSPQHLTIDAGDTVTWMNLDIFFTHTVTSSTGAWPQITLDPEGEDGDTASLTFPSPGFFPYFDQVGGTGSITVISGNTPPSVTITNPAPDSAFAALATFLIEASASDSDGSIESVEFFVDATSVGIDMTAPYSATVTNLAEGNYTLFAVATDNLGATTSDFINISVTNAPITAATLSAPKIVGGQFQFDISGLTVGKTNLVQASTNLVDWTSIQTNLAASSSSTFSQTQTASFSQRFYRVVQLP